MLIVGPKLTLPPALGSPINQGSDLAIGLVSAYLFTEGGGLSLVDSVNPGGKMTATSPSWAASLRGMSLVNPSAQVTTFAAASAYPCTLVAIGRATTGNNGAGRAFAAIGSGSAYVGVGPSGTTGVPMIFWNSSGFGSAGGSAVGVGNWAMLAGVFASTTSRVLYVNGIQAASSVTNIAFPSVGTAQGIGGFVIGSILGDVAYALFYNRALSAAEIQQLYVDPYCIVRPQANRLWIPSVAAANTQQRLSMLGCGS